MNKSIFDSKTIVLGVCGSIAAYKAAELCRQLVLAGAYVIPVVTKSARQFIGEKTFSVLASEPAKTTLFNDISETPHIRLASAADLILVAPATARVIGEYANGISRDLLVSTLLAAHSPVVFCPAMHTEMWEHEAVQENVEKLKRRGVVFIGPAIGRLSGGDFGKGRLADMDTIISAVKEILSFTYPALAGPEDISDDPKSPALAEELPEGSEWDREDDRVSERGRLDQDPFIAKDAALLIRKNFSGLAGKKILVTAGGTKEPIDDVRYIGNRSSGKQGTAIALAALAKGAEVTLVTPREAVYDNASFYGLELVEGGENSEALLWTPESPHLKIKVIYSQTAAEMQEAVLGNFPVSDVLVMAAAVADFRPKTVLETKYHKEEGPLSLQFEETEDILAKCAGLRRSGQFIVGFAAESGKDDLLARGKKKLLAKGLDMIVLNDISRDDIGFEQPYNEVVIYEKSGQVFEIARSKKSDIAEEIVNLIEKFCDV